MGHCREKLMVWLNKIKNNLYLFKLFFKKTSHLVRRIFFAAQEKSFQQASLSYFLKIKLVQCRFRLKILRKIGQLGKFNFPML